MNENLNAGLRRDADDLSRSNALNRYITHREQTVDNLREQLIAAHLALAVAVATILLLTYKLLLG